MITLIILIILIISIILIILIISIILAILIITIILIILIISIILIILESANAQFYLFRDLKGTFTLLNATALSVSESGEHSHGRNPQHSKQLFF